MTTITEEEQAPAIPPERHLEQPEEIDWRGAFVRVGHPLQIRILEELAGLEKASPSELAELIGEKLPNLSYHVRQLKKVGLLSSAGTRPRRGAVEHYYRLAPAAIAS